MVQCHVHDVLEQIFYLSITKSDLNRPWSNHHSSPRKGCQHVLMLLYIEFIDGQFPIQTATHSWRCILPRILMGWALLHVVPKEYPPSLNDSYWKLDVKGTHRASHVLPAMHAMVCETPGGSLTSIKTYKKHIAIWIIRSWEGDGSSWNQLHLPWKTPQLD